MDLVHIRVAKAMHIFIRGGCKRLSAQLPSPCRNRKFQTPIFQVLFIYFGESFCLRRKQKSDSTKETKKQNNPCVDVK
jgi:hypothetical protein